LQAEVASVIQEGDSLCLGEQRNSLEVITDDSPLFKTREARIRPLSYYGMKEALIRLLKKAELRVPSGKRYQLSLHSFRKFFKTQMTVQGCPTEIVEYFMGHKRDAYFSSRRMALITYDRSMQKLS